MQVDIRLEAVKLAGDVLAHQDNPDIRAMVQPLESTALHACGQGVPCNFQLDCQHVPDIMLHSAQIGKSCHPSRSISTGVRYVEAACPSGSRPVSQHQFGLRYQCDSVPTLCFLAHSPQASNTIWAAHSPGVGGCDAFISSLMQTRLQARGALLDRFLDAQDKVRSAAIASICRAGAACLEVLARSLETLLVTCGAVPSSGTVEPLLLCLLMPWLAEAHLDVAQCWICRAVLLTTLA